MAEKVEKKPPENKPSKWLVALWPSLYERLAACQNEQEAQQVCEAEFARWRARPTMKSDQSMRRPITDTQAETRRRVAAGELSEAFGDVALKYLNFSNEKWDDLNEPTRMNAQKRQEQQQFLTDVPAIVDKLTFLLESSDPFELAVALAGNVGARLIEVLQSMELEQVSGYSVMFWGQAKKGEREFPPYEKPTLSPAGAVIRGLARLRSLLPTQDIASRDVSRKFGPKVREAVNRHFAGLIPPPQGRADLFTHLFRSVYARIATFYYCPEDVYDLSFFSAICGHFELIEGTDEQRRIFADSLSYVRYKIVGSDKKSDNRQGIRLGSKGVEVLKVFQEKPDVKEEAPKKEKNYTIVRLRVDTNRRLKMEAARREIAGKYWADETVSEMLRDPGGAGGKLTPEQLVSGDIAVLVREALGKDGDFQTFLETALRKEARFQKGVDARYEKFDAASIPTSKLATIRHMDAANERYRRAVAAIAAHNDKATSPNDRWFINTTSVHNLVGGKFMLITAYLKDHQEEIDALNAKYNLTPLSNRKAAKINEPAAGPAQVIVPE